MKISVRVVRRLFLLGAVGAAAAWGMACFSTVRQARAATTEANITRLTTSILERSQFAHHPLDAELSQKFLESFLETLDRSRSLFLKSDVAGFEQKRAELVAGMLSTGNSDLAQSIWRKYLLRLKQRHAFVRAELAGLPFKFSGEGEFCFDRERAAPPKSEKDARALWRQQLRAEVLEERLAEADDKAIAKKLEKRYAQSLLNMKALNEREVLDLLLNALTRVYDPHSEYLGPEQMESLAMSMNLSLFGIGATLESVDGYTRVRELIAGGPASRSRLRSGDRIIAVAQARGGPVDIVNMPLTRVVQLIRGPKGTKVTLTVLPSEGGEGAAPTDVAIVRDEVQLEEQQASASLVELAQPQGAASKLGVIEVPSFYASMDKGPSKRMRSVTDDVARLLKRLQRDKIDGLVLDLRRNGGGSLDEAISLTGLFIARGPVVQTRGPEGELDVAMDPDPSQLYAGPLVVLTSRYSASASEILAGALQDYGRAVLVGDTTTFGKGTVQTILPLSHVMEQSGLGYEYDPGALKITVQKFYRPSGASTQLRGVKSDIVLPSTTDLGEISEASQDNALPWDRVRGADHARDGRLAKHLEALRALSAARVQKSGRFGYAREDLTRLRENLAKKCVSLNLEQRKKQRASDEARKAERDLWLKAHPAPTYKLREYRLKDLKKKLAKAKLVPLSIGDPAGDEEEEQGRDNTDMVLDEALHILDDYGRLLASAPAGGARLGARSSH